MNPLKNLALHFLIRIPFFKKKFRLRKTILILIFFVGQPKKQRRLKPNAIPSLCLTEDNSDNCDSKPKKNRKSQKSQNLADLEKFSYETVDRITENPWDVSDPSVFLKYCCPECDYSEQNLGIFSDHALKNHVNSIILFKMKPSDFVKCEILEENLTDEPLYNDYE